MAMSFIDLAPNMTQEQEQQTLFLASHFANEHVALLVSHPGVVMVKTPLVRRLDQSNVFSCIFYVRLQSVPNDFGSAAVFGLEPKVVSKLLNQMDGLRSSHAVDSMPSYSLVVYLALVDGKLSQIGSWAQLWTNFNRRGDPNGDPAPRINDGEILDYQVYRGIAFSRLYQISNGQVSKMYEVPFEPNEGQFNHHFLSSLGRGLYQGEPQQILKVCNESLRVLGFVQLSPTEQTGTFTIKVLSS